MDTEHFEAQERLLGRSLTVGDTRAMSAQIERLARQVVATPLVSVGSLFSVEPAAHAALIARLGRDLGR